MKRQDLKQTIKEEIKKILSEDKEKKTWIVDFKYNDQGDIGNAEKEMKSETEPTLGDVREKFGMAYGKIVQLKSVKEKK